jgi:hypothetical protein
MIRKSGIKGEFEIHDKRFLSLVLGNTWVERLHSGSLWAEGPVYFADGDYLLWIFQIIECFGGPEDT